MSKGLSHVLAALLLTAISVLLAVCLYLWVVARVGEGAGGGRLELLKVEGVSIREADGYTIVRVYVRNMGDYGVTVDAVYLLNGSSAVKLALAYSTGSPPIWGGDVYWLDRGEGVVKLNRTGLIFYEDFRDGYDPGEWVTISTLEPWQGESGSASIDPRYGLVLTIGRTGTWGTEKYGLRLKSPLNIGDGEFVAEYETIKLSGISDNYLAEVYFSQYATTGNPHSLDQFVATYINGWFPPVTYSTATVEKRDRYGYEWDYEIEDGQVCGRWLVHFVEEDDKVYVYYNGSYVNYLKYFSSGMYERPYVYLDVGIWSGESGTYSIAIPYLKVYDSLYVNVTGLEAGWSVMVLCGADVLVEKRSGGSYVLISRDEVGGYPLTGCHILVVASQAEGAVGLVIPPGEARVVTAVYKGLLGAGRYTVKVCAREGVEAVRGLLVKG